MGLTYEQREGIIKNVEDAVFQFGDDAVVEVYAQDELGHDTGLRIVYTHCNGVYQIWDGISLTGFPETEFSRADVAWVVQVLLNIEDTLRKNRFDSNIYPSWGSCART